MIKTPFGTILVLLNGKSINYVAKELGQFKHFYVDKRFQIVINDFTIGDVIECVMDTDGLISYMVGVNSGEDLALLSFHHENLILSIGAIGDLIGVKYTYLNNGIKMEIEKPIERTSLPFNIAWLQMDNPYLQDSNTWFAADPGI